MPTFRTRLADLGAAARRVDDGVAALAVAARDPRTPWYARAVLVAVVAYVLSPLDPIPDVIPVLGLLDEALVVPLGVGLALRLTPAAVVAEARERAGEDGDARTRARWAVAGLTVALWAGVAWLAWRAFAG